MTAVARDLHSLEDYFRTVRPYLLYREEDDVLIVPPNRVYKLNKTAAALFRWLDAGGRLAAVPGIDNEKVVEIDCFMRSLQDALDGKNSMTETVGYDFDFTRLPVLGEIAVTKQCNNACRFCYAGCSGTSGGRNLSSAQLKKIITIFRTEARIPFFSFTGGEPLLRKDLEKLIAFAEKNGLRTNLVSNGTLITERRARSLYRAGLRTAQISLEAANADLHDYLCGRKGAFAKTIAGIGHLQEAGISVQTNTTICAANRDSVGEIPGYIAGLGIKRFAMNMYIPLSENRHSADLFISYADIGPIVDFIGKKAKDNGLTFFWYSPTPFCHFNPVARGLGNKSCAAMDGLISVDYDGNVLPCSSYDLKMGNILEMPFEDIWFSTRAQFFKQKKYAPAECTDCSAFTACQAACPLYWQYAGCSEIRKFEKKRIVS
ncbi:MAG: radical SAM protein [Spirochaetales bacterium]|nr:radical SAM protein [Spirochaetales bacterium]